MTTIQQQIDFVKELAENFDLNCREVLSTARNPKSVASLLRDIHENLIGVRNWQLGHPTQFCGDCNCALTDNNRVNYAVADSHVIVTRNEHVCEKCTHMRIERMKNQTAGIP